MVHKGIGKALVTTQCDRDKKYIFSFKQEWALATKFLTCYQILICGHICIFLYAACGNILPTPHLCDRMGALFSPTTFVQFLMIIAWNCLRIAWDCRTYVLQLCMCPLAGMCPHVACTWTTRCVLDLKNASTSLFGNEFSRQSLATCLINLWKWQGALKKNVHLHENFFANCLYGCRILVVSYALVVIKFSQRIVSYIRKCCVAQRLAWAPLYN